MCVKSVIVLVCVFAYGVVWFDNAKGRDHLKRNDPIESDVSRFVWIREWLEREYLPEKVPRELNSAVEENSP